jgi:hypothetical protein
MRLTRTKINKNSGKAIKYTQKKKIKNERKIRKKKKEEETRDFSL